MGCRTRIPPAWPAISEPTFYRWQKEAADEKTTTPLHQQLVEALDEAQASFKAANLGIIRTAATDPTVETQEHVIQHKDGTETKEVRRITRPPTWQPAAWLLERRFPGEFGRRFIEHAGKLETDAQATVVQRAVRRRSGQARRRRRRRRLTAGRR